MVVTKEATIPVASAQGYSVNHHRLLCLFVLIGKQICGDFNIDLLNVSKHNITSNFLDALYSRGLFPLIT